MLHPSYHGMVYVFRVKPYVLRVCWQPILTCFDFLHRNWICLTSHRVLSEYLLHRHPVLGTLLPVQLLHCSATMGQL